MTAAVLWAVPIVLVETPVRDIPLSMAFKGINGHLTSHGAIWNWAGPIEYRSIVLTDADDRIVGHIPKISMSRGLLSLGFNYLMGGTYDLGTIKIVGADVLAEVRPKGSNLEDIFNPWLFTKNNAQDDHSQRKSISDVHLSIEIIDASVDLVDIPRNDSWRLTEVIASLTFRPADSISQLLYEWTAAGRLIHSGQPVSSITLDGLSNEINMQSIDNTKITAGVTAVMARNGGWSISAPASHDGHPQTFAVATHQLPLGVSSVAATRFSIDHLLDGLADARLDITFPDIEQNPEFQDSGLNISGSFFGEQLAVCESEALSEVFTIQDCKVPFDINIKDEIITIRDLRAESPLLEAEVSGRIRLPHSDLWEWGNDVVQENFAVAANVDLAALSTAIRGGFSVRPDVEITSGNIHFSALARPDGKDRVLELRAQAKDFSAIHYGKEGQRPLHWNEPFTAWMRGRRGRHKDQFHIEEARIGSSAIELAATATPETANVQWTVDINKLMSELSEVLDVERSIFQGSAHGSLSVSREATTGISKATFSTSVTDFTYRLPDQREWDDENILIEAETVGNHSQSGYRLEQAHIHMSASGDSLTATLDGGAIVHPESMFVHFSGETTPQKWIHGITEALSLECSLTGDVDRWLMRGEVLGGLSMDLKSSGTVKATTALRLGSDDLQITRANIEIEDCELGSMAGGWRIIEPRILATAAGQINLSTSRLSLSSAEVLSASLSLRTGGLIFDVNPTINTHTSSLDMTEMIRGKIQWQADISRIEKWANIPDTLSHWPSSGRVWGTAEVRDTPHGLNVLIDVTGNQLALSKREHGTLFSGNASALQPVWTEPQAHFVIDMTHPPTRSHEVTSEIIVNRLLLDSSTVGLSANGTVSERSTYPMVELNGTLAYDWSQLSRLLTPWTGGGVQLIGGGPRPFTVRGPLAVTRNSHESISTEVQVPNEVSVDGVALEVQQQRQPSKTITIPASAKPLRMKDWFQEVSFATSTNWTGANLGGLHLESGELTMRLFEGQLALGPFDIAASGGRLRGSPWIKVMPLPGELILPPGRIVEGVTLSPEICNRWVQRIVPLLGRSTNTEGRVNIDIGGGRLPLQNFFDGELTAQILFEQLVVTPSGAMQPLVNVLTKIRSIIDPRFAFGDKGVLLSVRPQPVVVRLANKRIWHEGLVLDTGMLSVRSKGSVGEDGSLDMMIEIAFRGDIAAQAPVIAKLLQTPLLIPLRGSVHHPQFDARQIDSILGRIVENTAEAVISDGLSRGLEALFGE